jgi:hypothetical protein
MSVRPLEAPRFVRRTSLGPNEYRKNFRQIDGDVISAVTSPEADRVTPLMSKIYLRLTNAPPQYWERDGVLRFEGDLSGDRRVTAWEELCKAVGVASATANKAMRWMHEQGIIGYFAGKNGVGLRIFLNRATSSIGTRAAGKKILEFTRASSPEARASQDEAAFSDSFADLEVSDTDRNPRAPKNGAEKTEVVKKHLDPHPTCSQYPPHGVGSDNVLASLTALRVEVPVEEIVTKLRSELKPLLQATARRAAAQEHERTREWLENRGLPKAARVAQREAYNVLRKYGVVGEAGRASHANVGRNDYSPQGPQPLADDEITELAQACVAMLEVQGQSVEVVLSKMSVESGGFLLPEDAPRVRQKVKSIIGDPSPIPGGNPSPGKYHR